MTVAAVLPVATEPPAATEPAEVRGSGRDDVRLLVAGPDGLTDGRFRDLPCAFRPGDLLVVNTSATLRASLPAEAIMICGTGSTSPNERLRASMVLPSGAFSPSSSLA